MDGLDIRPGELIVDLGAGSGALSLALLTVGAEVIAVEADDSWVDELCARRQSLPFDQRQRFEIAHGGIEQFIFPSTPFRVVANPPFGMSTAVLRLLLDDVANGPTRADLILQREVAEKRVAAIPDTLLSASWAPWWTFEIVTQIKRTAFRPVPRVDAAALRIERRIPPVLPEWLAPNFSSLLRERWHRGP